MNATDQKSSIDISMLRDDVALVTFDQTGSSANVFTADLHDELDSVVLRLETNTPRTGVVVTSAKPKIFIAGADLVAISETLDWSDDKIIAFCERGQDLYKRFGRLNCVTVAAIHGFCVGGGLEFALWCDRRVASNDRRTLVGLPEVKLGLVPGWAGTVNLPRMIGPEAAIDLTTSGDLISASEGKELGFIDRIVDQDSLLSSALELIDEESQTRDYLKRRELLDGKVDHAFDPDALRIKFEKRIESNQALHPFAPKTVLDHMLGSADLDSDKACHSEAVAMTKVYGSDSSKGLLNTFFLNERAKKFVPRSDGTKPAIDSIAIVGAGQMGRDIAKLCRNVSRMAIYDIDATRSQHLVSEIGSSGNHSVTTGDDLSCVADADLVIETVVEKLEVKRGLYSQLEPFLEPSAILVSNTSAITIEKLAAQLSCSDRFCGLHFCYPVEKRALVEVVRGGQTSDATISSVLQFAAAIGKTPVLVNDSPGFVVNRILGALLNEAFHLLSLGNGVTKIDSAMREFGWKLGPFEAIDHIGLPTAFHAGHHLADVLTQTSIAPPILPAVLKTGRNGIQSGRGFYKYSSTDSEYDSELDSLIEKYKVDPPQSLDSSQIVERINIAMINEAAEVLESEVVSSAAEIDICMIHGLAFPDFRGGLLFYADQVGVASLVERMNVINSVQSKGPHYQVSGYLAKLVESGRGFYDPK